MTEKKFTVRRGERVRVELPVERTAVTTPEQSVRGIIPIDADDDLYVRRSKSLVTVYDLGVRLRSVSGASAPSYILPLGTHETPLPGDGKVNEYVELEYQAELKIALRPQYEGFPFNYTFDFEESSEVADPDRWNQLGRALLGVHGDDDDPFDPFDYTSANGSGRRLPNVLQLPYENALKLTLGIGDASYDLNKEEADEWKQVGKTHSDEAWNPQNVADMTVFNEGMLNLKNKKRVTSIAANAVWHYESFASGDTTNFKVTDSPSYAAAAVPLSVQPPLRIFLVPQLFTVRREFYNASHDFEVTFTTPPGIGTAHGFGVVMHGWSATRLPVFPRLKPEGEWHTFLFPVQFVPNTVTPLAMDEQPEKGFLRTLNIALDRIAVQKKYAIVTEVSGQSTPPEFAGVGSTPYSMGDLTTMIDDAVEAVYAAANASVALTNADNGSPLDAVGYVEQISRIPAGQLVGAVEGSDGTRFYFWRAAAIDRLRDNASINSLTVLKE